MIHIIDNFLPEEEFNSIQCLMMGGNFKWFYCDGRATHDDGNYLMIHMFFQPDGGSNSEHIDIWNNFMSKIGAKECKRIKANLTFKTPTIEPGSFHIDYPAMKTIVYYINTNNGYTEFENGVRVESVSNRACIFDSNFEHRGVGHTLPDPNRIVVNFNYA